MDSNTSRNRGLLAENRAAACVEAAGFSVIARNVRSARAEIDLIARRAPLLLFIEVKYRSSQTYGAAQEFVDRRKQRALSFGAKQFLARHPHPGFFYRMDVIEVAPDGSVHWITDAFEVP